MQDGLYIEKKYHEPVYFTVKDDKIVRVFVVANAKQTIAAVLSMYQFTWDNLLVNNA